jgi:hypothetical protein
MRQNVARSMWCNQEQNLGYGVHFRTPVPVSLSSPVHSMAIADAIGVAGSCRALPGSSLARVSEPRRLYRLYV